MSNQRVVALPDVLREFSREHIVNSFGNESPRRGSSAADSSITLIHELLVASEKTKRLESRQLW